LGKIKDITGQVFGRLTVIEEAGKDKNKCVLWLCQCICGNDVTVRGASLRNGHTSSCGCLRMDRVMEEVVTHGHCIAGKKTPEYTVWASMIDRCYNPNKENYPHYGGRGITVCEEWRENFEQFLSDMGTRPSLEYTLDRIDVNGNYCKNNCRWVTRLIQSRNQRTPKTNTSGVRGVTLHKKAGKYVASIRVDGKSKHLGLFPTIEQAAEARKQAEQKYWAS
jgi:hypothetical protein